MRRPICLAFLAFAWMSASAPVQGQDLKETLASIPRNALGCIVTNRLDQISDKVVAAAKKVGVPLPLSPLDFAKFTLEVSNGVNFQGSAAVVVLPFTGLGDPVLFMLPVSNYEEFLGQFKAKGQGIVDINLTGQVWSVAGKGKHAWLIRKAQRDLLKAALSAKSGLSGLAQAEQDWVAGNDLTVLVTPSGIKQGVTPLLQGLAKAKDQLANNEGAALAIPFVDAFASFLKSVETDVSLAGLGTRLDAAGNLAVDARALFAKGSDLAKNAAAMKAPAAEPLAGLPAGPYALAFGGAIPPTVMETITKLNTEFIKIAGKSAGADLPPAKLHKLEQSYAAMTKGLNGMAFVIAPGKDDKSFFSSMVGLMRAQSAASYLDLYEKALPELNALHKELKLPFMPASAIAKKKVGKTTVLEATTDMAGIIGDDPMQKQLLEAIYGPGGKLKTSLAVLDPKTVIFGYTDAEGVVKIMKKASLQKDAEVARTLKLLPAGSQWILLVEPRGLAEWVRETANRFNAPLPVQIPELPQTPPIGVGARLAESGLTVQLVVPVQVFEAIGRLVADR